METFLHPVSLLQQFFLMIYTYTTSRVKKMLDCNLTIGLIYVGGG